MLYRGISSIVDKVYMVEVKYFCGNFWLRDVSGLKSRAALERARWTMTRRSYIPRISLIPSYTLSTHQSVITARYSSTEEQQSSRIYHAFSTRRFIRGNDSSWYVGYLSFHLPVQLFMPP